MQTKTRKKTRKPTQLDDALPDTPVTIDTVYDAVVNIHARLNRMEFDTLAIKELLKSPAPEPKEPEPWVPKVGDWVVCDEERDDFHHGWSSEMNALLGKPMRVDSLPGDNGWRFYRCAGWSWRIEWLRPATQAEIDARLEAEAKRKKEEQWALVSELQAEDQCQCSYEEACRLMKKATDAGIRGKIVERKAKGIWMYKPGELVDVLGGFTEQVFPVHEWERRLDGTIARLEAERKAEEERRPLGFGTPVRVKDEGEDMDGRMACEGPDDSGRYLIAYDNGGRHDATLFDRSEFTVIPSKP